jgi:hypothetical protein
MTPWGVSDVLAAQEAAPDGAQGRWLSAEAAEALAHAFTECMTSQLPQLMLRAHQDLFTCLARQPGGLLQSMSSAVKCARDTSSRPESASDTLPQDLRPCVSGGSAPLPTLPVAVSMSEPRWSPLGQESKGSFEAHLRTPRLASRTGLSAAGGVPGGDPCSRASSCTRFTLGDAIIDKLACEARSRQDGGQEEAGQEIADTVAAAAAAQSRGHKLLCLADYVRSHASPMLTNRTPKTQQDQQHGQQGGVTPVLRERPRACIVKPPLPPPSKRSAETAPLARSHKQPRIALGAVAAPAHAHDPTSLPAQTGVVLDKVTPLLTSPQGMQAPAFAVLRCRCLRLSSLTFEPALVARSVIRVR